MRQHEQRRRAGKPRGQSDADEQQPGAGWRRRAPPTASSRGRPPPPSPRRPSRGRATAEGTSPAGTKTTKAATSSPAPALMPSTPGSAMSLRGDALQKAPGKRQSHAHQKRGEHPGQPQVHQRVGEAPARRAGKDLPQLFQGNTAVAGVDVAPQGQKRQHGEDRQHRARAQPFLSLSQGRSPPSARTR